MSFIDNLSKEIVRTYSPRIDITKSCIFNRVMMDKSFFSRHELNFGSNTDIFIVIGCGGIGSWVSYILSMIPGLDDLIIFDNDRIEESNVGRTIFDTFDTHKYKVEAITEKINMTNSNIRIMPICDTFNYESMENLVPHLKRDFNNNTKNNIYVIDCRDDQYNDYKIFDLVFKNNDISIDFVNLNILRAGYNDDSITIDPDPSDRYIMGEPGYHATPSNILSSMLSALLIVLVSVCFNKYKHLFDKDECGKFKPCTFNLYNILSLLMTQLEDKDIIEKDYRPEESDIDEPEDMNEGANDNNVDHNPFVNQDTINEVVNTFVSQS